MISLEEIKKIYPGVNGFDRSLLREYLQYKILDIIFKSKFAAKISFLGGTAIKICYGSARFSEDLDFDNFSLSRDEFTAMTDDVVSGLTQEGYEVESRLVFKGAYRAYIRLPHLLKEYGLSDLDGEKILVQIDSAPHGFRYEPADFLLQKFDVFRSIRVTPADIVLSQKVAAILGRKRAKGRDFYDLVYLMSRTGFNFQYLDLKFGIKNKGELKSALLKHVENLDFEDLTRDVEPFLINPDDQERVRTFRQYIEQEL